MKKLVLSLSIVLFWTSISLAGGLVSFPGGGVPAEGAAESEETCTGDCDWVSSWSGSDEQNTGTSYVWDSITDASDELALLNSAGSCFAGDEAKCLKYTASASFATAYVEENVDDKQDVCARAAFYLDTDFTGTQDVDFFSTRILASAGLMFVYWRDSGTPKIQVKVRNSSAAVVEVGSAIGINASTWYQVRACMEYDTAGDDAGAGAKWRLDNESGIVGEEQYLSSSHTTEDSNHTYVHAGLRWLTFDISSGTPVYRVDRVYVELDDALTYDWPPLASW
jgi:hypothetical protein